MLWKVQISLRQKLALAGLFSITAVVMVFAIIRGAFVDPFSPQSDATWLFMWSNIELAVCKYLCLVYEMGVPLPNLQNSTNAGTDIGHHDSHNRRMPYIFPGPLHKVKSSAPPTYRRWDATG